MKIRGKNIFCVFFLSFSTSSIILDNDDSINYTSSNKIYLFYLYCNIILPYKNCISFMFILTRESINEI